MRTRVRSSVPQLPRLNVHREGYRVMRHGLRLGNDVADSKPVYLLLKWLATHLHVIGPTGTGKSRLLSWLFCLLCHTGRPVVLIDPKGGLYRICRDWALANGFGKRLVLFDLSGDFDTIPGYNPLRENGLRLDLQAQWIREAVRSAWNQATFDATPQLARMLYLTLYVGRALNLNLVQSLDILRPASIHRRTALARIHDPFIHGALLAFDKLSDRRKEELAASTLARLEAFCCDLVVQKVLCNKQSLDIEEILAERKILLVNFAKYQPLLPDTLKLLGRMFFNDLLANIYKGHGEGRFDEDHPVYVVIDEVQNFATRQMCDSLDEGRGIGCHMTIAHQHISQLSDEDQSGYLLSSVMNDARTKILFGDLSVEDLELLAKNMMLDRYNPWALKDEIRTSVFAPVETTRDVPTWSTSQAQSQSVTESISEADTVSLTHQHSISQGRSTASSVASTDGESSATTRGRQSSTTESRQWGQSSTHGSSRTRSQAETHGRAATHGRGSTRTTGSGSSRSSGQSSASGRSLGAGAHTARSIGEGQTMRPPHDEGAGLVEGEPEVLSLSANTTIAEGESTHAGTNQAQGVFSGDSESRMQAYGDNAMEATTASSASTAGLSESEGFSTSLSEGYGVAVQRGESEAITYGTQRSITRGTTNTLSEAVTDGVAETEGKTITYGRALTQGETITKGTSVSRVPFHRYEEREIVSSRTYLTPEEQQLLHIQQLKAVPKAHFVLKVPGRSAVFCCAPWVDDPKISRKTLEAGLARVHALPYYTQVEADDADAPAVLVQVSRPLLPAPEPADDDAFDAWTTDRPEL